MRPAARVEEVYCSNCKRYIGSLGRCPYCRTPSPKRRAYKLLKWGGLALAVFGVLALYTDALVFKVVARDLPLISVSEIEPTMNFATVRIRGTVTGVRYETDTKWSSFWVLDNEDTIFIRAFDSETKQLHNTGNFPGVGDEVEVVGQLRTRPGFISMILQVAKGLKINRPEPAEKIPIENIILNPENFLYKRVWVEGEVSRVQPNWPWTGMTTITISEAGAELVVFVPHAYPWFNGFDGLGISEGDNLRVEGGIGLYFEQAQLYPANLDDIKVI